VDGVKLLVGFLGHRRVNPGGDAALPSVSAGGCRRADGNERIGAAGYL
jgi:hypothetical protein